MFPVASSLETCLFVYGSAGTGKTLILCEALKIKLSQLLSQGRRVRILATGFYDDFTTELLNNFRTKYLVNMKDIEVMGLRELCRDLNVEYNYETPRDTINRVITSLSDKYTDTEIVTLLLVDEVWPCEDVQPTGQRKTGYLMRRDYRVIRWLLNHVNFGRTTNRPQK